MYSEMYSSQFCFLRLSWSSIKRSGLLRHNKPEMLLVVICVLLGSLLLGIETLFILEVMSSDEGKNGCVKA